MTERMYLPRVCCESTIGTEHTARCVSREARERRESDERRAANVRLSAGDAEI